MLHNWKWFSGHIIKKSSRRIRTSEKREGGGGGLLAEYTSGLGKLCFTTIITSRPVLHKLTIFGRINLSGGPVGLGTPWHQKCTVKHWCWLFLKVGHSPGNYKISALYHWVPCHHLVEWSRSETGIYISWQNVWNHQIWHNTDMTWHKTIFV